MSIATGDYMPDTFGLRLSQLIATRDLTQGEFAKRLGSSPAFISDMIRGVKKPGADFLIRLANEYHVSIDWLLMGKGSIDGRTPLDEEWLQAVMLRVELAQSAVYGNIDAVRIADQLLGHEITEMYDPSDLDGMLGCLAQVNEQGALIAKLYNKFLLGSDQEQRAKLALHSALQHFKSKRTDPLTTMVAQRNTSTSAKNSDAALASSAKQKITGRNHRIAGRDYHEK